MAGTADVGGPGGTGTDAGTSADADADGSLSYPFPTPAEPTATFCEVAVTPPSELCGGAANCPIVLAMAFEGTLRGIDAGLDDRTHALLTSETDVCLASVAQNASPSTLLNPFALPADATALVPYPIAVEASGVRHVFVSGEAAAVHFSEQDGEFSAEPLTVPDQLDPRVWGATFDDGRLDIVYSAHLPDPGSAYNHTLLAGQSDGGGTWETVTLWQGGGELQLDAVYFPVGGSDPSAHWYASRDERSLHSWRRSDGAAPIPLLLEYPWDVWHPVGRLPSGEALLVGVEEVANYPSGPLRIGLARDGLLVIDHTLPDTEGEPYQSGCPVAPNSFMFGGNACMGHAGEACTLVADRVGGLHWVNTDDSATWVTYTEEHLEWDVVLAEQCVQSEIDSGCTCISNPDPEGTSRAHITTTLARVSVAGDELVVDPRLRLEGTPYLLFLDARESTLVFGFEGSLVAVDVNAL